MSTHQTKPGSGANVEFGALLTILAVVAVMAGAASFTHVHDWTMDHVPTGTDDWFGWANAVISELTPTGSILAIRHKRRHDKPIHYPVGLLIVSGAFSLSAQFSQAEPSVSGWLLAGLPAAALMLLSKLAFSMLDSDVPATTKIQDAADPTPVTTRLVPAPVSAAPARTVLEAPADPWRTPDPYLLSATHGDREPVTAATGSAPGRTETPAADAVPGGWPTRRPAPRTESGTETPTGSTQTTPGAAESGTRADRESTGSAETPTETSVESDGLVPNASNAAPDEKPASGDESGAGKDAESGDDASDELTPTERARAHWDAERKAGRTPSGADLDRAAGTKDYGRGLRRKWLAEAEGRLHAV